MQLAGLKSITAKHLALSAQCLGALIALQPTLTTVFTAPVLGPRRSLLLPDFQRARQV
jgi:vacuolar protein sorting-associated protein 54